MFYRPGVTLCAVGLVIFSTIGVAGESMTKTIASLYEEKAALNGQQVQVTGKVVKVTNGVMNKNFLHLQDGSGGEGTNDLTVTSEQTAAVGDEVVITGTVITDVDFGMGYTYPLMVEKAAIVKSGAAP